MLSKKTALFGVGVLALSAPALAQFWDGTSQISTTCHQRYDLKANGVAVGHMVAVAHGCSSQPTGFTAGKEHWVWTAGPAWRGSFISEPVSTGPAESAHSWEVYDLDHFDLNTSEGFPDISPGVDDEFYKVLEGDDSDPPVLTHVAYMWLQDGDPKTQVWYGIDGVLASDLVGDGASIIKFNSVQAPEEDAIDINPLCDGECS